MYYVVVPGYELRRCSEAELCRCSELRDMDYVVIQKLNCVVVQGYGLRRCSEAELRRCPGMWIVSFFRKID